MRAAWWRGFLMAPGRGRMTMRWMAVATGLCGCVGPYYGPVSGPMLYPRERGTVTVIPVPPEVIARRRELASRPKISSHDAAKRFRRDLVTFKAAVWVAQIASGCGFRGGDYWVRVREKVGKNMESRKVDPIGWTGTGAT